MSERFVVPGEWVRQGDVLGLSGNNGRSSGAHLHWEVTVGGEWVDPLAFMNLSVVAPAE
jgi:murein DD-endopeptidase MepM/ murein hydrolase activator NlpD